VLVLLAGAALAAAIDVSRSTAGALVRWPVVAVACVSAGFLLTMTGLTVLINGSGLIIALAFLVAILLSSIISRWIRSTELRFHGFEFADEPTHVEWQRLRQSGAKVLVPHRPGLLTLAGRICELQRDGLLPNSSLQDQPPVIFIEALVGDPSNFYQRPLMSIACEEGHTVIRVSRCVSISHVLAAICLELGSGGGVPPHAPSSSATTATARRRDTWQPGNGSDPGHRQTRIVCQNTGNVRRISTTKRDDGRDGVPARLP